MKKNMLLLNTVRGVKKSPGRFVAILIIIAIGCAFYAGLSAVSTDLKNSGWKYYREYALADVQIKSTLGFNGDEIEKLSDGEHFDGGYAGYSADLLVENNGGQSAVTVLSYSPDQPLNKLYLMEGRLPEKAGECVADYDSMHKISFKIGDTVKLSADGDNDVADYLNQSEYTVVGLVKSPVYVSYERGSTTIGTGSVSAFIYVPEENFAYDAYTDLYLSVTGAMAESVKPFSDEYNDIVAAAEEYAEGMSAQLLSERSDEIRADADEQIADAKEKLADGQKKYDDAKKDYDKGLNEYNKSYSQINEQKKELTDAKKDIEDGRKELAENEEKMNALAATCTQIDDILKIYEKAYVRVLPEELLNESRSIQQVYDDNDIEASISDLLAVFIITNPDKDLQSKTAAQAAITGVNEQVRAASAGALEQISAQKWQLDKSEEEIDKGLEELSAYDSDFAKAKHELDSGKKKLDEAQADIDSANAEIADAESELEDKLADGEWYVWNRDEFNPGCMSYGRDAERIDSIAAVFPVFFILVAALVCCTTMSRMVEEQRTEVGTLRSLGYGTGSIILQYVLYAAIASVVGSLAGTAIGLALLPRIIFICYQTMYNYPIFEAPFMPSYALGCMGVSLLCTSLSAVYTCANELLEYPAKLIRPKPPKNGKRILLEKITPIWKHFSFSSKVTFRNLFRYKSRFFMTVISIGGCTALMLTAFGLKEAIACIAEKQYDDIFLYDAIAVIGSDVPDDDLAHIEDVINGESAIISHMSAVQETHDVYSESGNMEGYILALDDVSDMDDYVQLQNRKSGEHLYIEDGKVIITEKMARVLGVKEGDFVTIDGASGPAEVSGIAENYTFHYVYMTRDTYTSLFGETDDNLILINTGDTPEKSERDRITSELISCDGIISSSFMYDGTGTFRMLVSSLDLIVLVIIIFAGALALVILFNLANININERIGELATIKVLGFFDGEVGAYIYRENTISSIIGIAFGLVGGIFLESFVVSKSEVDEVMFSPDIPWFCFVLAAAVMVIFTVLVNFLLYFRLKKIDMTSSLKAIE